MKIWIARDAAKLDQELEKFVESHPEEEYQFGELHLFYEKPSLVRHFPEIARWEYGRIAATIPSYMFPFIRCKECLEFESEDSFPNELRHDGVILNKELKNKTNA